MKIRSILVNDCATACKRVRGRNGWRSASCFVHRSLLLDLPETLAGRQKAASRCDVLTLDTHCEVIYRSTDQRGCPPSHNRCAQSHHFALTRVLTFVPSTDSIVHIHSHGYKVAKVPLRTLPGSHDLIAHHAFHRSDRQQSRRTVLSWTRPQQVHTRPRLHFH